VVSATGQNQPARLDRIAYSIKQVADEHEAWQIMRRWGSPDILITDLCMPGQDGWTHCRNMLEVKALKNAPTVVAAGNIPEEDKPTLQATGVPMETGPD
jgi:CheY-like chemotaxis protein